ncbi:hypothetical protein FZW96_12700 [Bacillus sp. BGMRC 2118]|nr:hypothetical protein FZW96_12700 [Bacillus sp. BGMRC 2118]
MKKAISLIAIVMLLSFIVYVNVYNGFAKPQSITIQKFDEPFGEGTTIMDKKEISSVIGIFNRANYLRNVEYKLAKQPTYKIRLNNQDGESEIIHIYEEFDKKTTLLISLERGYFKINTKQSNKIIELY